MLGRPQSAGSLVFRWQKRNLELEDPGVHELRAVRVFTKTQMRQKELQVGTWLASLSPGCILEADGFLTVLGGEPPSLRSSE